MAAAGAAFAGTDVLAGAAVVLVPAAFARLPRLSSAEKVRAAEPILMAVRRVDKLIEFLISLLISSVQRAILDAQTIYSTLLTFPLVKVTFISL